MKENEFKLIKLNKVINKDVYDMYQEIPLEELGSSNSFKELTYDEFKKEAKKVISFENKIDPEINSKTVKYIFYVNEEPIGEISVRTTLNDFWVNYGSQIFYKIRSSKRGKGYGTIMVSLIKDECRKYGFDQIRVNCDDDNVGSKKVILKNGGKPVMNYKNSRNKTSTSYIIKL